MEIIHNSNLQDVGQWGICQFRILDSQRFIHTWSTTQTRTTNQIQWWRFWYLVIPLPLCGMPLLGCLLAWTLVLALCFFFSPLLGCFLFMMFGRVSSSNTIHIYQWFSGIGEMVSVTYSNQSSLIVCFQEILQYSCNLCLS